MSLPIDDVPRQHHLDIIKCYRKLGSLRLVRLKLGYADKSYVHRVIQRYAPEIMRRPYEHFSWESRRKKNAT